MGCCNKAGVLTDEQRFGFSAETPCAAISVDLLQTYKKPIDCYLKHGLWDAIGATELELINARDYLQGFIDQKIADPNDCTGLDSMYIVRELVNRMIQKGVCL